MAKNMAKFTLSEKRFEVSNFSKQNCPVSHKRSLRKSQHDGSDIIIGKKMAPAQRSKLIIGLGVAFTTTFVLYTAVYLPFYSPMIEDLKKAGVQNRPSSGGPKSVWANMDREIKDKKDGH